MKVYGTKLVSECVSDVISLVPKKESDVHLVVEEADCCLTMFKIERTIRYDISGQVSRLALGILLDVEALTELRNELNKLLGPV